MRHEARETGAQPIDAYLYNIATKGHRGQRREMRCEQGPKHNTERDTERVRGRKVERESVDWPNNQYLHFRTGQTMAQRLHICID